MVKIFFQMSLFLLSGPLRSSPTTHSSTKQEGFGKDSEIGSSVLRDLEVLNRGKSSDVSQVTAPKYSFSSSFFGKF